MRKIISTLDEKLCKQFEVFNCFSLFFPARRKSSNEIFPDLLFMFSIIQQFFNHIMRRRWIYDFNRFFDSPCAIKMIFPEALKTHKQRFPRDWKTSSSIASAMCDDFIRMPEMIQLISSWIAFQRVKRDFTQCHLHN